MQGTLSGRPFYQGTLSTMSTACATLDTVAPFTERAMETLGVASAASTDCLQFQHSVSMSSDEYDIHVSSFRDIRDGLAALAQSDHDLLGQGLQKCTSLAHVQAYHHHITMVQLEQNTYLANLLVSIYARYGALNDCRAVFEEMQSRNVVTWTAIITTLARQGLFEDVLLLYRRMQEEGTPPNNVTLIGILGACTSRVTLIEGKRIHASIKEEQLCDVILSTSLVVMYGRCGSVEDSRIIFDQLPNANIVTWNAMITVYVDHEHGKEALRLFHQMQSGGVEPNDCTYINSLKACGLLEDVAQGKAIHACCVEQGLISDAIVCNSLINMYGKCAALDEAVCVFANMPKHDVITWNGIISTYAQQGHGAEALEFYRNLQQQGVRPERVTFISVIGACASINALEEGKCIHACLLSDGIVSDLQVGNALIHMYGRCGALGSARAVFDRVRPHSVISWTAIIAAFAQQGHAKAALQLFQEMQEERVKPDEVTYITVLSACSHAGLVEEGRSCFVSMEKEHGLTPNIEHYVCMIDLFGRAGLLSEAEEFIRKMPRWHDGRLWAAMLSSCTIHSDTSRGKHAAKQMMSFGSEETAPYVLLGNLYAANIRKKDPERKEDPETMRTIIEKIMAVCAGPDG